MVALKNNESITVFLFLKARVLVKLQANGTFVDPFFHKSLLFKSQSNTALVIHRLVAVH